MKVMLLGATGLLGHNVLQQLTAAGHTVVAPVRRAASVYIAPVGCSLVERPHIDLPTLLECGKECDAIVNCVGNTDMSLRHVGEYMAANCDLCVDIVEAMEQLGIRRLVHTSTTNTIGNGSAERPSTGDEPMTPPFVGVGYAESKRMGEEVVLQAANRHPEWHVVVVNAGYMIGAMDVKPSSGRMLLMAYGKRLMVAPKGGKAFVPAHDVAVAEVMALEHGECGKRYPVVGGADVADGMSIKEMYQMQAQVMGYQQWVWELPNWLLRLAGKVGDALRRLGVHTELCTANIAQLTTYEHYSNQCAVEKLGYAPTSIAKAIEDFYYWNNAIMKRI